MHLRRVIGLVTALSMSHLMLLSGDLACATHGAAQGATQGATLGAQHGPVAAAAMNPGETLGHHTGHGAVVDSQREAPVPCDTPARPDCCQAMTSCSTTMSAAMVPEGSHIPSVNAGVLRFLTSAPTSHNTAPEPPPPKA